MGQFGQCPLSSGRAALRPRSPCLPSHPERWKLPLRRPLLSLHYLLHRAPSLQSAPPPVTDFVGHSEMKPTSILRGSVRNAMVSVALCGAYLAPRVCLAETSAAPNATATDDNARLQALFRKGVKAFDAGKNEEAVQILSEA